MMRRANLRLSWRAFPSRPPAVPISLRACPSPLRALGLLPALHIFPRASRYWALIADIHDAVAELRVKDTRVRAFAGAPRAGATASHAWAAPAARVRMQSTGAADGTPPGGSAAGGVPGGTDARSPLEGAATAVSAGKTAIAALPKRADVKAHHAAAVEQLNRALDFLAAFRASLPPGEASEQFRQDLDALIEQLQKLAGALANCEPLDVIGGRISVSKDNLVDDIPDEMDDSTKRALERVCKAIRFLAKACMPCTKSVMDEVSVALERVLHPIRLILETLSYIRSAFFALCRFGATEEDSREQVNTCIGNLSAAGKVLCKLPLADEGIHYKLREIGQDLLDIADRSEVQSLNKNLKTLFRAIAALPVGEALETELSKEAFYYPDDASRARARQLVEELRDVTTDLARRISEQKSELAVAIAATAAHTRPRTAEMLPPPAYPDDVVPRYELTHKLRDTFVREFISHLMEKKVPRYQTPMVLLDALPGGGKSFFAIPFAQVMRDGGEACTKLIPGDSPPAGRGDARRGLRALSNVGYLLLEHNGGGDMFDDAADAKLSWRQCLGVRLLASTLRARYGVLGVAELRDMRDKEEAQAGESNGREQRVATQKKRDEMLRDLREKEMFGIVALLRKFFDGRENEITPMRVLRELNADLRRGMRGDEWTVILIHVDEHQRMMKSRFGEMRCGECAMEVVQHLRPAQDQLDQLIHALKHPAKDPSGEQPEQATAKDAEAKREQFRRLRQTQKLLVKLSRYLDGHTGEEAAGRLVKAVQTALKIFPQNCGSLAGAAEALLQQPGVKEMSAAAESFRGCGVDGELGELRAALGGTLAAVDERISSSSGLSQKMQVGALARMYERVKEYVTELLMLRSDGNASWCAAQKLMIMPFFTGTSNLDAGAIHHPSGYGVLAFEVPLFTATECRWYLRQKVPSIHADWLVTNARGSAPIDHVSAAAGAVPRMLDCFDAMCQSDTVKEEMTFLRDGAPTPERVSALVRRFSGYLKDSTEVRRLYPPGEQMVEAVISGVALEYHDLLDDKLLALHALEGAVHLAPPPSVPGEAPSSVRSTTSRACIPVVHLQKQLEGSEYKGHNALIELDYEISPRGGERRAGGAEGRLSYPKVLELVVCEAFHARLRVLGRLLVERRRAGGGHPFTVHELFPGCICGNDMPLPLSAEHVLECGEIRSDVEDNLLASTQSWSGREEEEERARAAALAEAPTERDERAQIKWWEFGSEYLPDGWRRILNAIQEEDTATSVHFTDARHPILDDLHAIHTGVGGRTLVCIVHQVKGRGTLLSESTQRGPPGHMVKGVHWFACVALPAMLEEARNRGFTRFIFIPAYVDERSVALDNLAFWHTAWDEATKASEPLARALSCVGTNGREISFELCAVTGGMAALGELCPAVARLYRPV